MKYFAELFKRWGIWSSDPEVESPKPSKESDPTSPSTTLSSDMAATTAQKPTPPPGTRPQSDNLRCNNETDFPGHADIAPASAKIAINFVCSVAEKGNWSLKPGYTPRWQVIEDGQTHNHRFTWSWIEGCTMGNDHVLLNDPFGEGELDRRGSGLSRCQFAFADAWFGCNNGGVGGSVDVGCIKYLMESGI